MRELASCVPWRRPCTPTVHMQTKGHVATGLLIHLHSSPPGPHYCTLCNTRGGHYTYLDDLLALDGCRPPVLAESLPTSLTHIVTPLRLEGWEYRLAGHPDQAFAAYLLAGIREGFRIGFNRTKKCIPAKRNLRSVQERPDIIDAYILNEASLGRDCALPFGLRSAPKIFSAVADGLMWMIHSQGFPLSLHYLDDFLLLGPAHSPLCQQALSATLQLCNQLGIQVAEEKTDGPATTLTFLGIEIDSQQQQIHLPHEKLANLTSLLNKWMPPRLPSSPRPPRCTIKKRDLLSLIGLLNHAASVVRPGRTFLRSLIDASTTVDHLDHHVTLHAQARADIIWWHTFINRWNGISTLPEGVILPTPMHLGRGAAELSGAAGGSRSNGRGHGPICTYRQMTWPQWS